MNGIVVLLVILSTVVGTMQTPPQALPIVTFARHVTFRLGDEKSAIVRVDPAHTDGDSFVRFRAALALHMGDCCLVGIQSEIDYSNGGSYTGIFEPQRRSAPGMHLVNGSWFRRDPRNRLRR